MLPGLVLAHCVAASAGDVGITYVKTIGQVWPALPMITGGGRLAVDEKCNLYAGTPGQNSFLQKITPDGRVAWRADDTHCSYYGTAVDDKYVYGSGLGYYGYGHLLRRKKESGVVPPGWNFVWTKPTDIVKGVRGFGYPGPLLVDNTYLYVLDLVSGEVRRLAKESGAEEPLATPIKIEGALDMALAANGNLLVLVNPKDAADTATTSFVSEINRETGEVVKPALISGLRRSAAIAVKPDGSLYIGEGGGPTSPVNKVRVFTATGASSGKTIGRGGEWQGKWSEDAFNFATLAGDIAFDPEGGWWSNSFGGRMMYLGLLVHRSPEDKTDKVFKAATGTGLVVDSDLNLTIGGNFKMSWNGEVLWTSGLVSSGKPGQFPYTIDYWTMLPAYADAQQAIFVNIHGPQIFSVSAQTGEATGKGMALPVPGVAGVTRAGTNIYILGGGKILRTNTELAPLEEHLVLPKAVADKNPGGIAVSADLSTTYISAGAGAEARIYAYKGGALLWEAKAGTVLARYKGMLLAADPSGVGILALDAADGSLSGVFGNSAIEDRPAITGIMGASIGGKDGIDYLFVACQSRVMVYRIVAAE